MRNDLPPEAEIPVINIESADSQFASAYLSFTSDILQANQITDYLVRVVQPRLSALEGVQRADILGGRTFAMRIWLKPDRLAALDINPAQVRQALAANNFLSAIGQTRARSCRSTSPPTPTCGPWRNFATWWSASPATISSDSETSPMWHSARRITSRSAVRR